MASKFGRFARKFSSSAGHGDEAKVEAGAKLWSRISNFVGFPGLILCSANVLMDDHHEERPEFIPYDHLRVMKKPYPWADGKRGLFHNPKVNALKDGYED